MSASSRFAPFRGLSPRKYFEENYDGEPTDADAFVMRRRAARLLHTTEEGELGEVLVIGTASNIADVLPFVPFAGRIILTDMNPEALEWLRYYTQPGALSELKALFGRHQDVLEALSPIFEGGLERLAKIATVKYLDILDPPSYMANTAVLDRVAESMTTEFAVFQEVIRNFVRMVVPGGQLWSSYMKNPEGSYSVGNKVYPAVYVTRDDAVEEFSQLGVTVQDAVNTPVLVRPNHPDGEMFSLVAQKPLVA